MYGECDWLQEEDMSVGQPTQMEMIEREAVSSYRPQLVIDRDIQFLCRPLHDEERSLLEQDLKDRGCINPIIYWDGHRTILDGHNRYEICNRLEIAYHTKALSFETKDEAINWVIENQLGRRNLSTVEMAILRGKLYLNEKKAPHRPGDSKLHQNEGVIGETADRIAKLTGVSPSTIERDGVLAEAVDILRMQVGDEFSKKVLDRRAKLTKKGIIELSKKPPEDLRAIAEQLGRGVKLPEAEKSLRTTVSTTSIHDGNLKKIEQYLGKIEKILLVMETTTEPERLVELLAKTERISEGIKALMEPLPDLAQKGHLIEPEGELHGSEIEFDDDAMGGSKEDQDDPTALPSRWEEYRAAMKIEMNSS